ncbi:MAG: MlaD family protein [Heliobacteriaceae bacterium]|jgi:hypothetical protein|nr:MlaD family protein [Heliobacteriaceae bacterium]
MKKIEDIRVYILIEFAVWFLILCLAVGGIKLYRYNQYKEFYSYQIFLQDADGLIVGSPVKFMGVQIGYIDMLKIVSNDVYARFRITDKNFALPDGVIATVEFSGMGGSKSLEIYPPTEQSLNSDRVIYVGRPKRLHDALGLLNDMYTKIGSITGRLSYFINETDVLETGLETTQIKKNIDLLEKWINYTAKKGAKK